jgi:carbon-monoxide dehydrogenase large subunit
VLLDIAARRMGLDPIELRRRNLLTARDMPYTNPNGMAYDAVTPRETFEHALAILDYESFRRAQLDARAEGRYLGVGTATYVEPTTSAPGSSPPKARRSASSPRGA